MISDALDEFFEIVVVIISPFLLADFLNSNDQSVDVSYEILNVDKDIRVRRNNQNPLNKYAEDLVKITKLKHFPVMLPIDRKPGWSIQL